MITFALSSCYNKTEKENCLNQVDFIYTLRKSIPLKYVGGFKYKTFSFYRNESLCLKIVYIKVSTFDQQYPIN